MTAIVGIAEKGRVWLGGDSAASYVGTILTKADGKVSRLGEFVVGACGNGITLTILRYSFRPPKIEGDLDRYMSAKFVCGLRDCLKKHDALGENSEEGMSSFGDGGAILVGVRGCLYWIDNVFSVARLIEPYCAIGSGGDLALGALHALKDSKLSAEEKIDIALGAAARFNDSVAPPFTIVCTPKSYGTRAR